MVRLANGRLSKVGGFPKGAKLNYLSMIPGAGANAEDSSGQHWIIELKPNGTEKRRTKAVGTLYKYGALYYVDF